MQSPKEVATSSQLVARAKFDDERESAHTHSSRRGHADQGLPRPIAAILPKYLAQQTEAARWRGNLKGWAICQALRIKLLAREREGYR